MTKNGLSSKAGTILLYSSKSFLTSWDWTSIWSYLRHRGVRTKQSQHSTNGESQIPVVWRESVTGAAAWWRVLEHLWTWDTKLTKTNLPPIPNPVNDCRLLPSFILLRTESNLGCSCCPATAACCWSAPAEQPGKEGSPPLCGETHFRNLCSTNTISTHAHTPLLVLTSEDEL